MNTLKDFDVNLNSVNNDDGDDTSTYIICFPANPKIWLKYPSLSNNTFENPLM